MNTAYFNQQDHEVLATAPSRDSQQTFDKLYELHRTLYRRMRDHNYDLHPHWNKAAQLSNRSASCSSEISGLTIPYLRSREQAVLVERLMGRESADLNCDI